MEALTCPVLPCDIIFLHHSFSKSHHTLVDNRLRFSWMSDVKLWSFLWKDQQHRTGNNIFILLNTKTRVLPLCTAQRCVSAFPSHPSPRRQHTTCPPNILALKYQWAQRNKTIEYYRGPSPPTVGCHWTAPECHWTAPMPCLHKAKI